MCVCVGARKQRKREKRKGRKKRRSGETLRAQLPEISRTQCGGRCWPERRLPEAEGGGNRERGRERARAGVNNPTQDRCCALFLVFLIVTLIPPLRCRLCRPRVSGACAGECCEHIIRFFDLWAFCNGDVTHPTLAQTVCPSLSLSSPPPSLSSLPFAFMELPPMRTLACTPVSRR